MPLHPSLAAETRTIGQTDRNRTGDGNGALFPGTGCGHPGAASSKLRSKWKVVSSGQINQMILLVDHDPEILDKARDILDHDRHVLAMSSAEQALAMVRRLGFWVVLVDLGLPDGPLTLIQKLHATNPNLPIIRIIAVCSRRRGRVQPCPAATGSI